MAPKEECCVIINMHKVWPDYPIGYLGCSLGSRAPQTMQLSLKYFTSKKYSRQVHASWMVAPSEGAP
jgi:hypothetical protein